MSRYAALLMLLLSAPIPAPAADTPGWSAPLSLNMPLSCFRFMPVGLCVWITCTPFGCDIDTSIKFGHFNPDAVVELVNPQGVNRVEAPRRPDMRNRNHNNLIYKDAHALGHPLAGQFYCPSQAIPLMPYFYSPADPLGWRWGLPDALMPAALVPGLREIGHWPINTWSAVFPRTGWTLQASEPKAAAVNAQRVGDIITRNAQAHVYLPMTGPADKGGKKTWEPGGLEENTHKEGYWQMLYPTMQNSCEVFGENDLAAIAGWGGGKAASDGDYAFTLWRPYTCCEREGASLLFHIDWIDFPP